MLYQAALRDSRIDVQFHHIGDSPMRNQAQPDIRDI